MLKVSVKKRRGSFHLDAQLELPRPGVVALFGRSGCGKSTLVNVIAGLLSADTGTVVLDDATLLDTDRHIDVAAERRGIGYVFQDARLFPHMSVLGNLRYALNRARRERYVNLDAVSQMLDLDGLMRRRPQTLSGGEQQRVAIGRALLSQPRLLLLDEPLASLDTARREEVFPYLEILRDRMSIPMVYVSHNYDEVLRLATHIVLMKAGKTVAQGELGAMSLNAELRSIIGPDAVGAVVDGTVLGVESHSGLTRVQVGQGELKLQTHNPSIGERLRVQLLARDLIVATQLSDHLSVRNQLSGVVVTVTHDDASSDLISIDIGGTLILARVTRAASRELSLAPGLRVWALVKAVSLRSHLFAAPARATAPESRDA
jgi:molybdate transport system ATP-binding protein